MISCNSGWPLTHYVPYNDLELRYSTFYFPSMVCRDWCYKSNFLRARHMLCQVSTDALSVSNLQGK